MGSSVSHEKPADVEKPPIFRAPFIGPEKAGKTSLISKFQNDKFEVSVSETVAIDHALLNVSPGEEAVRLAVWDCSGKERYWTMISSFTRDAPFIVMVYDVTCENSLNKALRTIKNHVDYAEVDSIIFLVGNKMDLKEEREVACSTGEEIAKKNGYVFVETSAMTGENVQWLFEEIGRRLLQRRNEQKLAPNPNESIN